MSTDVANEVVSEEEIALEDMDVTNGGDLISFPLATVRKILREALPEGRFSLDFIEAMNRCMGVFVLYMSAAAQEVAQEQGKSTIAPADVNAALIECGFGEIADEVRRNLKLESLPLKKRKRVN